MTSQITTINPAAEEVINTYEIVSKGQIKEKTKKAQNGSITMPMLYRKTRLWVELEN